MSRMTQRQIDALRFATAAAEGWNQRHQVGQLVEYRPHRETGVIATKTRSPAFVVDNHRTCVVLEGRQGIVDVRNCQPIEASAADEFAAATGSDNPHFKRRRRLRAKLGALINELDVQRACLRRAAEAVEDDSMLEFKLDAKNIGRDLEAIAIQLFNLHLTEEPRA